MSTEIEHAPSAEIVGLAPGHEPDRAERLVEKKLWRTSFKSGVLAIPICIVIYGGIMALAITTSDSSQGFWIPLAVTVGIGVVAGAFFGGAMAFLRMSDELDAVDHADAAGHSPG
jgi:hypothetical protein